jgi:hypothetical protein
VLMSLPLYKQGKVPDPMPDFVWQKKTSQWWLHSQCQRPLTSMLTHPITRAVCSQPLTGRTVEEEPAA